MGKKKEQLIRDLITILDYDEDCVVLIARSLEVLEYNCIRNLSRNELFEVLDDDYFEFCEKIQEQYYHRTGGNVCIGDKTRILYIWYENRPDNTRTSTHPRTV